MFSLEISKEDIFKYVKFTVPYFIWILLHFVSSHVYAQYCTPKTVMGYLLSPLTVTTPHCKALRWIIYHGGNTVENMWVLLGIWLCSKLVV